jgi:hypothetical protein
MSSLEMMRHDDDVAEVVNCSRCLHGAGAKLGHGDDIATSVMLSIMQEATAMRLRPGGMIHTSCIM